MSRLIVILVACICAEPVSAQECQSTDTFLECWDRYISPAVIVSEAAGGQHDKLADVESGLDTSGADVASSVKDFLSLLNISGLVGNGGDPSDDQVLTLDLNFLIPGLEDNGQLQAVANPKPEFYSPLDDALRAELNQDQVHDVLDAHETESDYGLSFSYSPTTRRLGRNFEQYRTRFENLVRYALPDPQSMSTDAMTQLTTFIQGQNLEITDLETAKLGDLGPDVTRAFEQVASEQKARLADTKANLRTLGLSEYALLVSNQPQLHVSARRDVRSPTSGPDELTFEVTYETGFINLNTFDREHPGLCAPADVKGTPITDALKACGTQLKDFATDPGNRARIERGDRLAFSLAYTEADDYGFSVPDLGFRFATDGVRKLTASVAYGRLFDVDAAGDASTRLDLEAKYEDVSDDPTRNERGVASVTITKKVGALSIPITLVYATKPEFLPDTDAEVGAHVGIVFSAPKESQ